MKKALFIILILLITLPGFVARFSDKPDFDLNGESKIIEKPEISINSYLSNQMQDLMESYLASKSGFRGFFIRAFNQADYSLFNTVHGDKVVMGKNGILFDEWYINAWTGRAYIGEDAIDSKLYKMKLVQQALAQRGIKFLFVIEPDKVTFYEDKIPHRIKVLKQNHNNYEQIAQRTKEIGINSLNFQEYFKEIKDTSEFSLYPKNGIHWSTYGSYIALNKIIERIEQELNTDLNDIDWAYVKKTNQANKMDYDLGRNINILFPIPQHNMAYPFFEFEENPDKKKPKMLVVGDSYYFNQYNSQFTYSLFQNSDFWYYGAKVYPDYYQGKETKVKDIDWIKKVEEQDIILLMVTSRFMHNIDWGFIDNLFHHYYPKLFWSKTDEQIEKIHYNHDWFYGIINKAEQNNITTSQQLYDDAEYVRNKKILLPFRTIKSFRDEINAKPEQQALMKEKAIKNKRSLKDQIILDAIYMAEKQNSDIDKIKLEAQMEAIKADIKWYNNVKAKAKTNHTTVEEQLKKDAQWTLDHQ